MCDICRRTYCPPACPNYRSARDAVRGDGAVCSECGMPLSDSEWYYSFTAGNVCAECAERLDTEDLIRLAGLRSRGEMLSLLGGERRR